MNIDQIAICYASLDSSQRALQTDRKLVSNFELMAENKIKIRTNS